MVGWAGRHTNVERHDTRGRGKKSGWLMAHGCENSDIYEKFPGWIGRKFCLENSNLFRKKISANSIKRMKHVVNKYSKHNF
jgi:hypothetical protein